VKEAVRLRTGRHRAKQERILVDGAREIQQALAAGVQPVEAFICESLCRTDDARRAAEMLSASGGDVWQVTPEVFAKLAFGERDDGVLLVAQTPSASLAAFEPRGAGPIAVIEGIEKPGNVGAVLRSADAAGVAGLIVAEPVTDLFNPNCIRASLGAVFRVPVCTASSAETLAWLRARELAIFAARVDGRLDYTAAPLAAKCAIVLGSEAAGLSPAWYGADVTAIRLPMRGAVDSLNISATAAVLFYESLRQRAAAPSATEC
jgi:TrmH family RNA methyltransferase